MLKQKSLSFYLKTRFPDQKIFVCSFSLPKIEQTIFKRNREYSQIL